MEKPSSLLKAAKGFLYKTIAVILAGITVANSAVIIERPYGLIVDPSKAVTNHHAGLFIADTQPQVQVDQLRVTDTQLAPEMARLSNQVTFTPLDDNQSSSGVSVALNGLNVNSLSDFGQSLGNNLTSAGAGVLAAEAVRAAGGGNVLSSLAGSSASATTSLYLNQLSANNNHERRAAAGGYAPSGLETMGQISYHRNGLETHLALVDVKGELLRENIARLDIAVDMLSQPEGVLIPELIEDDMVPLATALKEIRQDLEEVQQRVSGRQQSVKKASKRPLGYGLLQVALDYL